MSKLNPIKGIPVLEDEEEGPLTPVESVIIRSPSPTNSSRLSLRIFFKIIKGTILSGTLDSGRILVNFRLN